MAWCENEGCHKNNLRKADVEFCETTHKVLCQRCYVTIHPEWSPSECDDVTARLCLDSLDSKIGFAIQISDADGIKAKLSYGGASIAFQAPATEIKKLFGI